PDGRFMTDTTPMIQWFEEAYPEAPVIPQDPVLRFISLLLEDYAEEWLWRPAMHYRWSYAPDRLHLARKIVDEMMADEPAPAFLKRAFIRRRQHVEYVKKDGVDANTWAHVESIYLHTLDRLQAIFATRPFVLGERPTVADFGFFAPMFRHFSQDPTASDIMRLRAPGVFAWQARLWDARASAIEESLPAELPDGLDSMFADISSGYLPYLNANAEAWQQGLARFDPVIQSVQYRGVPVSQYRVWCLEQLQARAGEVPEPYQAQLKELLTVRQCWAPLFSMAAPGSRYDEGQQAPFRGRKVHYHNRRD
ncbi:MAG: glutathione S-transferase C-terminal domain-containing protein, partial [Pseudomonadota bacterium]